MNTFTEHRKGQDETSVWNHFLIEKNGQVAKCKKCAKEIKCTGGSTSGLHTHLKTIHGLNLKKKCESPHDVESSVSKQPKLLITNYFKNNKNEKLSEVLARMTARDGLSFNIFIKSYDIREGLKARGFKDIPKSAVTIRNMVLEYSKIIKQSTVHEISRLKSEGKRFSITFDEWTSIRNRRYININVHSVGGTMWNIGLVRAYGSVPAEKCLSLVEEKLKDFNLDISKDIVGVTTDGASVMVKLGKIIEAEHQQCMAHCINLAITDVLYKSTLNPSVDIDVVEQNYNDDDVNDVDDDDDNNDDDIDEEDGNGIIIELDASITTSNINIRHTGISSLVSKIRKVVKTFKNSPSKNDKYLQKYVREQLGKETALKLDIQTRWNSMLFMLEKFEEIKFCIQKALIDISSDIHFSDEEFNLLSSIIAALTPVKLTVDALCRKDANLLTADASLTFMLDTLSQQKSAIALELLEALKSRILLRRTELSQILQYLQKGSQDVGEVFKRISKFTIIKKIVSLTKRLTHENLEDTEDMEVVQETSLPISSQISNETVLESDKVNVNALKKKLQAAIDETLNTSPVPAFKKIPGLEQKIKDEITFFEKTGTKGTYLQNVYDFLMTIVPTSVESERAFSAAGYICTKIRSSLDDEAIDCLCFLRAYFNKQNASY